MSEYSGGGRKMMWIVAGFANHSLGEGWLLGAGSMFHVPITDYRLPGWRGFSAAQSVP